VLYTIRSTSKAPPTSSAKLSEDEFVGGIQYLVKNKIINVD
jgi:hypothetical protein